MISEHSAIRIQLEGRLEIVEEELARWRAAEAALASENWPTDHRWQWLESAGEEAVTAVSRKLNGDEGAPEAETLKTLRRAQEQVRAKAIARLVSLRVPIEQDRETLTILRLLREEVPLATIVWRGASRRALPVGLPFFAGAGAAIIAAAVGFEAPSLLSRRYNLSGAMDFSLGHHGSLGEMLDPSMSILIIGISITFVALGLRVALGRVLESRSKQTDSLVISSSSIRLFVGDTKFVFARPSPLIARVSQQMGRWVLTLNDAALDFDDEPVELVTALRTYGVRVDDL